VDDFHGDLVRLYWKLNLYRVSPRAAEIVQPADIDPIRCRLAGLQENNDLLDMDG